MSDSTGGPVVLGAGNFGGLGSPLEFLGHGLDEAGAHAVLDRCATLGITFVDTAHSYAAGAADRMIGTWLAEAPSRSDEVAVLHKVGVVADDDGLRVDLSAETVRDQVRDALERLGVDTLDVLAIHAPDDGTPTVETARVFADLHDSGTTRAWGLSNVGAEDLADWLDVAEQVGLPAPRLVENGYNLLERDDEAVVLPRCRELGIEYLAYSPLAGGVLTGKYTRDEPPPAGSMLALRPDSGAALDDGVHAVVDTVTEVAQRHGCAPASVALAWVRSRRGVRPIVGPRRPEHLDAVEEMLGLELTDDDLHEVDQVSTAAAEQRT